MDKSSDKAGFGSHIEKTRAPRAHRPHVGTDFHFDNMVAVLSISEGVPDYGATNIAVHRLAPGVYSHGLVERSSGTELTSALSWLTRSLPPRLLGYWPSLDVERFTIGPELVGHKDVLVTDIDGSPPG